MISRPITQEQVNQSYQLLALLNVVAHASRNLDQAGDYQRAGNLGREIADCIEAAHDIAGELHDCLEVNMVREVRDA